MQVLFGQHDRRPDAAQSVDKVADFLDHDGCQAFAWLIEQQHIRVAHEGAAHGQHLLLAAGKLSAQP